MTLKSLIFEILNSSGLEKNDKVLLHSNIKPLYKYLTNQNYKFEIEDIVDSIIEYFNSNGTVIIPAFNFDFCKGASFDSKNTISQMGVLSEVFRKKAQNNRSWHPVYSFSIHGNIPNDYLDFKNYDAFGEKSMFHWLHENNGKIAILDLPDQNSMTFYHYAEQTFKAKWRYHKKFRADYINFDRKITNNLETSIFVRKIEKDFQILTDVTGMQKRLEKKELYKSKIKGSIVGLRSINARDVMKEVELVIKDNIAEGLLYKKV
jgi:aminoglycoside 3-N-acetyltransferase|tara:strand:- start:1371 stop:2156 length:786 start_codon:yes stop_codon:yes gene_type:complete